MSQKPSINPLRVNISMNPDFHERMSEYSEKKDLAFSGLIRSALRLYTNDEGDCFVELVDRFAGATARKKAKKAIEKHAIPQDELLDHILDQASRALNQLKDGQNFEDIKFTLPANTSDFTPPEDEERRLVREQIEKTKRLNEKAN